MVDFLLALWCLHASEKLYDNQESFVIALNACDMYDHPASYYNH